jgi:formiminoglutamase
MKEFFLPPADILHAHSHQKGSIGHKIAQNKKGLPGENSITLLSFGHMFTEIRSSFYQLFDHFQDLDLFDLGMFKPGASPADDAAGKKEVLSVLKENGSRVIILSDDYTAPLYQWGAYVHSAAPISVAMVLPSLSSPMWDHLHQIISVDNKKLFYLSLIGMQSYWINPLLYEEIHPYFFEDLRLGDVRHQMESVEPPLREASFGCIDLAALEAASFNNPHLFPGRANGIESREACSIARYMGLSNQMWSVSINRIPPELDDNAAQLIAQMLWFVADGTKDAYFDHPNPDSTLFKQVRCPVDFGDIKEVVFLQSLRSDRWWMLVPHAQSLRWVACTNETLEVARGGDLPEQWFKALVH